MVVYQILPISINIFRYYIVCIVWCDVNSINSSIWLWTVSSAKSMKPKSPTWINDPIVLPATWPHVRRRTIGVANEMRRAGCFTGSTQSWDLNGALFDAQFPYMVTLLANKTIMNIETLYSTVHICIYVEITPDDLFLDGTTVVHPSEIIPGCAEVGRRSAKQGKQIRGRAKDQWGWNRPFFAEKTHIILRYKKTHLDPSVTCKTWRSSSWGIFFSSLNMWLFTSPSKPSKVRDVWVIFSTPWLTPWPELGGSPGATGPKGSGDRSQSPWDQDLGKQGAQLEASLKNKKNMRLEHLSGQKRKVRMFFFWKDLWTVQTSFKFFLMFLELLNERDSRLSMNHGTSSQTFFH